MLRQRDSKNDRDKDDLENMDLYRVKKQMFENQMYEIVLFQRDSKAEKDITKGYMHGITRTRTQQSQKHV